MIKGQKSVRGGIEDMLHPCTDIYITQGSNGGYSHKGIMANDIRGKQAGVREPYYAPCTVKCMAVYPSSGQAMWQSTGDVRCPNGYVGKVTFMTAHDDSFNAKVGMVVPQGNQLGNMGTKGNATGVHLHFQTAQTSSTKWYKNNYGIYRFENEVDIDDVCFVDNTNILKGMGGNWRTTDKVPVVEDTRNFVNLPPSISSWAFYDINESPVKKNANGSLNPKKFGGLSYYVYEYRDNGTTAVIETVQFGKVKIYIKDTCATITVGSYKYQNGNH